MEKLNRAQKCSILGPQNLGSREGPGPPGPPWICTCIMLVNYLLISEICLKNEKKKISQTTIITLIEIMSEFFDTVAFVRIL